LAEAQKLAHVVHAGQIISRHLTMLPMFEHVDGEPLYPFSQAGTRESRGGSWEELNPDLQGCKGTCMHRCQLLRRRGPQRLRQQSGLTGRDKRVDVGSALCTRWASHSSGCDCALCAWSLWLYSLGNSPQHSACCVLAATTGVVHALRAFAACNTVAATMG